MQGLQKNMYNIRKLVHLVKELENERLYCLSNEIEQELLGLTDKYPTEKELAIIKEKFTEIRSRISKMIKKETGFIWPYVEKLIEKQQNSEADTYLHYKNLSKPVEELIIEQRRLEEKCEALKFISHNCISFHPNDFEYQQALMNLFDLYQMIERHIYLEESIILPLLVRFFEYPENKLTESLSNQNSHVRS